MKKIKFLPLLWIIAGGVICFYIYTTGDTFKIGSFYPLKESIYRWLSITLIVLAVVIAEFYFLFKYLERKQKEKDEENQDPEKKFLNDLDKYNESQLKFLQKNTKISRWIKSNFIYQIPWFFVLGKEGSGKTSLLKHFDLENHIDHKGDDSDVPSVQWKIVDQALFVDIQGDIFLEKTISKEKSRWQHFLKWIINKREKRPINGILLTIEVNDFINKSKSDNLKYATDFREKLLQINLQFGTKIPIYIIITKLDILEGFEDFVENIKSDVVFGMTFPLGLNESKHLIHSYEEQYQKISENLNKNLLHRFQSEATEINTNCYLFVKQIGGLKQEIKCFIQNILQDQHPSAPLLRGIFFSSTHQTIDSLNAIRQCANTLYTLPEEELSPEKSIKRLNNDSFFSSYLPKNIFFKEAGLATDSIVAKNKRRKKYTVTYTTTGISIVVLLATWLYFYDKGKGASKNVLISVDQYNKEKNALGQKNSNIGTYLSTLNLLRDSLNYYAKQSPLVKVEYLGLYRGDTLESGIDITYQRLLSKDFLKNIEDELLISLEDFIYKQKNKEDTFSAKKSHYALEYLRVIRLISVFPNKNNEQKIENLVEYKKSLVIPWMKDYWSKRYKNNMHSGELQKQLLSHLEYGLEHTGVDLDEKSKSRIKKIQTELMKISLSDRIYQQLKSQTLKDSPIPLNISHEIGIDFYTIFKKTNNTNTFNIDYFFTKDGFLKYYIKSRDQLLKHVALDAWVLGKKSSTQEYTEIDIQRIKEKIRNLYISDYTDAWDYALKQLNFKEFNTVNEAVIFLKAISNKNKPLSTLVSLVKENTVFSDIYAPKPATTKKGDKPVKKKPSEQQVTAKAISLALQNSFQMINGLDGKTADKKVYINEIESALKKLSKYMATIQKELSAKKPKSLDKVIQGLNKKGAINPIISLKNITESIDDPFKTQLSNVADQCQKITMQSTLQDLDKIWKNSVYSYYLDHIKGKYPLDKKGKDMSPEHFKAFFSKGGILDKFYQNHFQAYENDANVSETLPQILNFYEHVDYIRKGFFSEKGSYSIKFSVKPLSLSNIYRNAILDIDGVIITYQHEKPKEYNVIWPNPKGATKQSSITLNPLDKEIANEIYTAEGEWAWLRLLDKSSTHSLNDQSRDIRFTGKKGLVNFKISVTRSVNPMTKDLFTGFYVPATLIK